jgi:GNAT superfamily N-acetyltransferase
VVVGWIEVGIAHHLQSGACGEIGGLIVCSSYEGRGIGRQLVETAERWVASRGITKLVVRSRITRAAAHDFYLGLNFERLKTSAVFKKTIELP